MSFCREFCSRGHRAARPLVYDVVARDQPAHHLRVRLRASATMAPTRTSSPFDMIAQANRPAANCPDSLGGARRPARSNPVPDDRRHRQPALHAAIGRFLGALYQRQFNRRGARRSSARCRKCGLSINGRISYAAQYLWGHARARAWAIRSNQWAPTPPSETYPCKGGGPE